jgi:hypothetical protein
MITFSQESDGIKLSRSTSLLFSEGVYFVMVKILDLLGSKLM